VEIFFEDHAMLRTSIFATTTFFGLLMAGTAQAALTADQVWAHWQDVAATAGLRLAAEETATEGDALRLSGVTVRPAIPMGADDPEGKIDEIVLASQSDGSVSITLSPEFVVPLAQMGGGVTVSHQGLGLTAREMGAAVAYDYAAAGVTATVTLEAPTDGDGTGFASKTDFVMTASDPQGTFSDVLDGSRLINFVMNATKLAYTVSSTNADATMTSDQSTSLADVALALSASVPANARLGDVDSAGEIATLLNDGLSISIDMTQGDTTSTDKTVNPFLNYEMTTTSLPGAASLILDKSGIAVKANGKGGSISGTSDMLPAPIDLQMGPLTMDFLVPLTGVEPQDFRYMVKLEDLKLNEEAWALFDPGQTLPRDPAALEISTSGKATLDLLALAEAQNAGMTEVVAPSIQALEISAINLTMAGAAVAGSGAFTFDNSTDTPTPIGNAEVMVTGANGLIDKLVTLGLLPEDQAMSARMMMGMFLVPGDGDDVLTSTVEAKAGGSLFVNGMQIQ
jgi:hypothetical protein